MCGIVGVVNKGTQGIKYQEQKVFEQMLFVDTLRGGDSTGVFGFDAKTGEEVYVHKAAVAGPKFLDSDGWSIMDKEVTGNCKALVGHNRSATRGAVSDKNAHPFHHGKIVLIHNGTLKTWFDLKKGNNSIDVDSEAICYSLSLAEHWKEVLPLIDGAFALVWYDLEKKSLFIASNGERPLWYAQEKNGALFFASEYQMLALMLNRNNVTLYKDEKEFSYFPHERDSVLEIPFDFTGNFTDLKFEKFKKKAPPATVITHTSGGGGTKKTKPNNKTNNSGTTLADTVKWVINKREVLNDINLRLSGTLLDNPKVKVCCVGPGLSLKNFSVDDVVTSTPTSSHKNTGTIFTACDLDLYVPSSATSKTTKNGVTVTKEEWDGLAPKWRECCMCYNTVTWKDLSKTEISFFTNNIPEYIVCKECLGVYH